MREYGTRARAHDLHVPGTRVTRYLATVDLLPHESTGSKGTDYLEARALEDVVGPVDADVVDVVLAVA